MHMVVRGHRGGTQVISLCDKFLYPLSHLWASMLFIYFETWPYYVYLVGLKLMEIYLPWSPRCWVKGVHHHAFRLHVTL